MTTNEVSQQDLLNQVAQNLHNTYGDLTLYTTHFHFTFVPNHSETPLSVLSPLFSSRKELLNGILFETSIPKLIKNLEDMDTWLVVRGFSLKLKTVGFWFSVKLLITLILCRIGLVNAR